MCYWLKWPDKVLQTIPLTKHPRKKKSKKYLAKWTTAPGLTIDFFTSKAPRPPFSHHHIASL